ncbi:Wings apart-like protein-like isoform A [Senna tora]|uniref:Wings apart-like protein-like isoform A n=1 Tax=Senna tora TaxID=362788 RepID=A0A834SH82_9FABA|nr:Wings apart-like protein-like isoform A [Senna tora]
MIVRTYGRRNRPISRTYSDSLNDDVSEPFRDSLSQESSQDHLCGFAFSSQGSSSHWSAFDSDPCDTNSILPATISFDELCDGASRKSKRARTGKKEREVPKNCGLSIPATSTLMEAQEFGEMMEHVDEVNFALDGLRKGQPMRIRRSSLVSLLSICGTAQQRRLLRTQGMAKAIVDAILGLSLDDSTSNLAAAALFYILTSDGQDDRLLDSPGSIRFLIKLLRPIVSKASDEKEPKFGSKLLALRRSADILKTTSKTLDSSSVAVFSRVQDILVKCKELKTTCQNDSGVERPELCPIWLALMTIEKACLSAISLDETTGAVRKAGGNFKEKIREHGGLDAVFEVAMNCNSDLENWMEDSSLSTNDLRKDKQMKSLTLLLKCLKIMENATFLSKDNQTHLLRMKGKLRSLATSLSFTELVIRVIKMISDLYLRRSASVASSDNKTCNSSVMAACGSELDLLSDLKENETSSMNSSRKYHGVNRASSDKRSNVPQNSQVLTYSHLESSPSIYEIPSSSVSDSYSLEMRVNSSTYGSCSGASRSSDCKPSMTYNSSRKNVRFTEGTAVQVLDDSQDPFAFDEDDFQPSKWDLMSGKQKRSQSKKCEVSNREFDDLCQSQTIVSQLESNNGDVSCSSSGISDEEVSSLLADCLLTGVKVLMNLTNDNPVGCRQIAVYGGLETMSSLIAGHFPSFSSSSVSFSQIKENNSKSEIGHQCDVPLTDQELDFLVAILGLLVNLVEKDSQNRSRLAAARVLLPASEVLDQEAQRDVIQLLCSIFLANQGGDEGSGDDKHLQLNDEAALLESEKEAEKMIVEAYSALLLAFLSTESKSIREAIANNLPDRKLATLVPVLDRFVEFHLSLNMISPETHKAVSEVIESCRIP